MTDPNDVTPEPGPADNTTPEIDSTSNQPTPEQSAQPTPAQSAQPTPVASTQSTTPPGYPFGPPPTRKEKKPRSGVSPVALVAIAALVGGGVGAGAVMLTDSLSGTAVATTSTTQRVTINDTDSVSAVSAVAAKSLPSVVTITVSDSQAGGSGSGVIISEDGYIVTNTHVVTLDGNSSRPQVQVRLHDGSLYEGEIIGTDPYSDLAVIKIDAEGLASIEFADSDQLNVGEKSIAIGAPLGLANTVTDGIVSALYRGIEVASSAVPDNGAQAQPESENPFDFWNYQGEQDSAPATATISLSVIQTDAAINPGNSGGALLDSAGKLIGINVAILSNSSSAEAGSIGLGFAVPSNLVKRVSTEIIESGSATHGLLGASVSAAANADGATREGALIEELSPGGAAERAGLKTGDIVTQFNGVPITNQIDLTAQVRAQAAGSSNEITIYRDGVTRTYKVTLGSLE